MKIYRPLRNSKIKKNSINNTKNKERETLMNKKEHLKNEEKTTCDCKDKKQEVEDQ